MFEVSVLERSYNLGDPDGKTRFFNEVAKQLLILSRSWSAIIISRPSHANMAFFRKFAKARQSLWFDASGKGSAQGGTAGHPEGKRGNRVSGGFTCFSEIAADMACE